MRRRDLLLAGALGGPLARPGLAATPIASALPRRTLVFPRDHGAHPELRTEWWYVTGQARVPGAGGREFGFQVTFFRTRVDATQSMQSAFAAKQLIFAHAALTDVQGRKLWHDQRIAREGFGVAGADGRDAAITLRDWSLTRRPADGAWLARLPGNDFSFDLVFEPTQPVLLQGDQGLSRKGPDPGQASYYYSLPQMAARGRITLKGRALEVSGQAWLDHEWSEALLHPDAVGWDWIGMNLLDGSALTAFRLRSRNGRALWDGGSFRPRTGSPYIFSPGEVVFSPQRVWKSPASQATYPVEWIVRTPADFYTVRAVIDNQELDSRASTGAIYWEGLSELLDSNGRLAGRGYLEMTGYAQPLRL
jgi:predicted secreted hydrolase